MLPVKPDGSSWHPRDANKVLQSIAMQVTEELRARDRLRGIPKNGSVGRFVGDVFVVDPRLSALKHSGEETIQLRKKRWADFCSVPRDPIVELGRIGQIPFVEKMTLGGLDQAIEQAIAKGIEAGLRAAMEKANGDDRRNETARATRRSGQPNAPRSQATERTTEATSVKAVG